MKRTFESEGRRASGPTDADVMTAVGRGDPGALGVLFDRHHARLFNFFLRMTGRRSASEDLVQETFLRIWKYRTSFRGESAFAAWMYRIARNVFADSLRSGRETGALDDERPDPGATPLEAAERGEQLDLLRRALLGLPDDRRELLVLCRLEGLRQEEVADLVGCSVGAVKVRLHRALAELRDAYFALTGERP